MTRMADDPTIVEQLAEFAAGTRPPDLPAAVAHEAKRIILDSVGCALAAVDVPAGQVGIRYGRILGTTSRDASIIGTREPSSIHGAAFANAELMNALDFDAVAAPGHVAPYVVPVVLALGEGQARPGPVAIAAVAVAHELSARFAAAMDRNRDITDGRASTSPVLGYASTVFGATAAAGIVMQLDRSVLADALGIAAATSQVNGHRAWLMHAPAGTIKNSLLPGGVALAALTAAYLADFGHRGDRVILDDAEFGYRRFIGTRRWEPAALTADLGGAWTFPEQSSFKPYPHCRVPHALFDALLEIVEAQDLHPEEIEIIRAWGEEWASQFPTFMNREIDRPFDAQFSFAHGLALAAHRVPPGKDWQDPGVVYRASVLDLMGRVEWQPHPDWARAVSLDATARPGRVEVVARGETFVAERSHPKGSRSRNPSTYLTDSELVAKFVHNANGLIEAAEAASVAHQLLALEDVADLRAMVRRWATLLPPSTAARASSTTDPACGDSRTRQRCWPG
jgi:2-methylcitrate dehydratase PrpD